MYCPSVLFFWVLLIYWQMCSKVEFEKKKKFPRSHCTAPSLGGLSPYLRRAFSEARMVSLLSWCFEAFFLVNLVGWIM